MTIQVMELHGVGACFSGNLHVIQNEHLTTPHTNYVVGFFVPPSELYTSYEKLLMPFDELTWLYLILTFGFSFGFIFFIKLFAPMWFQVLFFGYNIGSPAFNLLGIFFGIGQVRLPAANFARIVLMAYIIFCLIIQTAYQGVFFEMLTHDLRKPQMEIIDDLYENSYVIYGPQGFSSFLNTIKKSRR
jgi:hypothetical protein